MLKKLLILGAVSMLSVSAYAAKPLTSGIYVEGNAGYGQVRTDIANVSNTNTGFMGGANAGYKFNQYLAVEIGINFFSKTTYSQSGIKHDANKSNYYYDVAAKGILPLGDYGFDLFGKLGLAMAHTSWDSTILNVGGNSYTKPVGLLGLGVDYYFTPQFAAVAQTNITTKSGDKVPSMLSGTIGISYLFPIN